jgi:hypothetical protein
VDYGYLSSPEDYATLTLASEGARTFLDRLELRPLIAYY